MAKIAANVIERMVKSLNCLLNLSKGMSSS